ncbi:PilN domain-containing protein [Patescibacteria group bacterium]|nr:PilN domain-containing protein [Patescibacteria group bacterium]MBU1246775.1 PilN domain-containing protein [Patescibacteria group bacterium]MBU1519101.1 PilN domain-containing protein [Patescibacteria group bacterium]MBU1730623.1 PilN domain-containing protein [Patescibacteria group bacterium]MBU1956300.1 PilN domain-containing protein [Patescibacteria group bacterium]
MTNLLPQNKKKEIYKEYTSRVFVVLLSMLGALLLFLTILLAFVYILLGNRLIELSRNHSTVLGNNDTTTTVETSLKNTWTKLKLLKHEKDSPQIAYGIFKAIIEITPKEVLLTRIAYTDGQLMVNGNALYRKNLQDFIIAISAHEIFLPVNYPFSNITQKENISFSLKIKLKHYNENTSQ